MTEVSLTESKDSYQGGRKVLAPLKSNLEKAVGGLDQLVVKINFVTTANQLATTPLATVRAFVDLIKPFYKGKIVVAEEATIGSTKAGFERFGFYNWAKDEPQVEIFDSSESENESVKIKLKDRTLTLPLAKIYTQSSFTVSICRAKTHDAVVVTLGIKNLLVGAITQEEGNNRFKIHQGKLIHSILVQLARHVFPDLVIIDGVVGMEGDGPGSGTLIESGWLAASFDALAADSLAAYLMGFKIEEIGYLVLLRRAQFGSLFPQDKIKILGADPGQLVRAYRPHRTFEQQRNWR